MHMNWLMASTNRQQRTICFKDMDEVAILERLGRAKKRRAKSETCRAPGAGMGICLIKVAQKTAFPLGFEVFLATIGG